MKKKHYIVYQIKNLINNKIYVGQHQTYNKFDKYMGGGQTLKKAIQKYGIDNFSKDILFEFDNFEDMNQCEINIVTQDFINRKDNYNNKTGGSGKMNGIPSEETRIRLSIAAQHKPPCTQETRDKISKIVTGRRHTDESKAKLSKAHTGKFVSEETRKKIGLASKGRFVSEETKMKLSIIRSNQSEETRKKISETAKIRYTDERRLISSKTHKGKPKSDEQKIKMSLARKLFWERKRMELLISLIQILWYI